MRGEKTRGPEIGSRSNLMVVAHVFSWPPARLRHVRRPHQRPGGFARSSTQHGESPSCVGLVKPTDMTLVPLNREEEEQAHWLLPGNAVACCVFC